MEKLTKEQATKIIEQIKTDMGASYWLKYALETALKRDPVDAWKDADLLVKILDAQIRY